jgi:hypothetical protein
LFIYEAPSLEAAEAIVAADPYTIGGAFARTELKVWEVVKAQPTLFAPSLPAGGDRTASRTNERKP